MARIVKKKETFALTAPEASTVVLMGDFTAWDEKPIQLKKQKDGTWKAAVPLGPGTYEYRFQVDGQWRNDPQCTTLRPNPFGEANCVREVK